MKITLNDGVGVNRKQGVITLEGHVPTSVMAALYAAIEKLAPHFTVDMGQESDTPINIHPLDMAEILNEVDPKEQISLIRLKGKLYYQTTNAPRKGNKIV